MKKYIGLFLLLSLLGFSFVKARPTDAQTYNDTLEGPNLDSLVHISETNFKPFQIVNDDDPLRYDRYRIVDDQGKIGYANGDGYVIINPKFAFAFPFDEGMAKVTDAGECIEEEGSSGENHRWKSDDWYYINKDGKRLSSVENSSDGTQRLDSIEFVYFNNEWIREIHINMVPPESVTKIEIGKDEYGNKCAFVSVSANVIDSIQKEIDKALEGLWIEYNESYAEFPGGIAKRMKWLEDNIQIPAGFKGMKRVVVTYLIQPDGTVTDGKIIKGSDNEELNLEALRLVESLPKFKVKYYTPRKVPFHEAWPIVFKEKDSIP